MPLFLQELSNLPWVKLTTNHMTFHVCFCPWDHNTHGSMVSLPSWMKCLETNILAETCTDAHNSLLSGARHYLLLRLSHLVCSTCGPTLLPRQQLAPVVQNTLKDTFLHVKSMGKGSTHEAWMHIFLILNQDGGRLTWTNFLTSSECIPKMGDCLSSCRCCKCYRCGVDPFWLEALTEQIMLL